MDCTRLAKALVAKAYEFGKYLDELWAECPDDDEWHRRAKHYFGIEADTVDILSEFSLLDEVKTSKVDPATAVSLDSALELLRFL